MTGPTYASRTQGVYTQGGFTSCDARLMAYSTFETIPTCQSGLAGAMPVDGISAAQMPNGFDYTTNVLGIGGTMPNNGAINIMAPLVQQPQFAQTYMAESAGTDTGFD
jgi:hypothetical protein